MMHLIAIIGTLLLCNALDCVYRALRPDRKFKWPKVVDPAYFATWGVKSHE